MTTTADFHEGQAVVYRAYPGAPAEDGTVIRSNDRYVFVLYRGDATAKATNPTNLEPAR